MSEIGISFRGIPTVKKAFPGEPYHARLDVPRPAVWYVTRGLITQGNDDEYTTAN